MSEASAASNPVPQKKARKSISPARHLVGLVVLVVVGGVAVMEWTANRSATAAGQKLEQAMSKEEDADLLTQTQVQKLIAKKPDGPGVPEENLERVTYTWKGLVRKYTVKAYYTRDKEPHLVRYSTE